MTATAQLLIPDFAPLLNQPSTRIGTTCEWCTKLLLADFEDGARQIPRRLKEAPGLRDNASSLKKAPCRPES